VVLLRDELATQVLVRQSSHHLRSEAAADPSQGAVGYEFHHKAIVTYKPVTAASVLAFFNGREIQEQLFGEAKQHASLDDIPCRRLVPNQLYVLSAMLAHNLGRELQLQPKPQRRHTTPTRAGTFIVRTLGTLRDQLIRRAGALIRQRGRLALTTAASTPARDEFDGLLQHRDAA